MNAVLLTWIDCRRCRRWRRGRWWWV